MATGNDILAYGGNANLAFGGSGLPSGSTDAILDTSPALAAWQQYAQGKYLKGKEEFDRLNEERLKNAKALQDALNIGNYKIWDADREEFMSKWDDFNKKVKQNPTAVYDPNNPEYLVMNDMINTLKQTAAFSSQQYEDYKTNDAFKRTNLDKIANPNATEDFRNLSIEERAQKPIMFNQKISLNPFENQKELMEVITYDNPTITSDYDKGNNVVFTINEKVNSDGVKAAIKSEWEGSPDKQNAVAEILRNSPELRSKYRTDYDYFEDFKISALPLDDKTKVDIKGVGFAPAYTQQPKPGSDLDYVNEVIRRVQNKDSDLLKVFSGTLDGRLISKAEFVETTRPVMETKDGKSVQKLDANGKRVMEQVAGAPTKIKITFTDGKDPLEIVIPQEDKAKGLKGGAYNTLYALIRKIEKENNYNIQEVAGDVFSKPEVNNQNSVPSTSESGIKWQK